MAKKTNDISVEEKLRALYDLQIIDSRLDEIRNTRGELPIEVEDLEIEIAGLEKRAEKFQLEIKEQKVEIETQKEELDIYSRLICGKLSTITKSELALRLDTNTIRVAKLLKALGIYTNKTNQISAKFLDLYPNIKIIKSNVVRYKDGNGELRVKKDWIYTGEGSNMVVRFLVNAGLVVYCENKGFKLKGMNSDEAFSLINEHRL